MKYYLAIDIGASSGRHIVGWQEDGQLHTEEVFRFPNGVCNADGHLVWDVKRLLESVIVGIRAAFMRYPEIESLSVDTWGVDYVRMCGDREELPAFAYRDSRTERVIPGVHETVPFSLLYSHTGCQFQPFNTVYQLCDDLQQGRLNGVTDILMMPEYLLYKLSGVKAREFTNATTTGLVNACSGQFDLELTRALGLPDALFPKLQQPGTTLGQLLPEVAEAVGGNCKVVLCATHDTASAVAGIPMTGNAPYISSGTWSLLGVKTPAPITDKGSEDANYSNEGGIGYNRYQKNIMGMWLINELHRELCPEMSIADVVRLAEQSSCDATVDANAAQFLAPRSMRAAFDAATEGKLHTPGDYFRCAYLSLAQSYAQALEELESNTNSRYDQLYIVGGGAKNSFLNDLTAKATGKQVIALPIEATALGNLKVQMEVNQ